MSTCEKCWGDAYVRMRERGGTQAEHYADLLQERKDNPCTPEQQRNWTITRDSEHPTTHPNAGESDADRG